MKICFIVPWITKGRGGTENVGQMMASAMAARGHEVDVVTFDDDRELSHWPLASQAVGLSARLLWKAITPRSGLLQASSSWAAWPQRFWRGLPLHGVRWPRNPPKCCAPANRGTIGCGVAS